MFTENHRLRHKREDVEALGQITFQLVVNIVQTFCLSLQMSR